jgi:hypothetical protein
MIDLAKFTFEQIVEMKKEIDNYLIDYSDGFQYICYVHSYGRHWKEYISNLHSLQELCYRYNGDEGIVEVYSTNPDIANIENYGSLNLIRSVEDYEKWRKYDNLKNIISEVNKDLEEWNNRENLPFLQKPKFEPVYNEEELENFKKQLENFDMSFEPPKDCKQLIY